MQKLKACIIVENGVQDQEFFYPYYRLKEENIDVTVLTPEPKQIKGKYGIPIPVDSSIDKIPIKNNEYVDRYDLLIIPGGWECPERLRSYSCVLSFISDQAETYSAIIAAICHGPQVLISTDAYCNTTLIRGRTATCYNGMKHDLVNAGAIYSAANVVVDNNVVTAQHYNDNPEFMKTVLDTLYAQHKRGR